MSHPGSPPEKMLGRRPSDPERLRRMLWLPLTAIVPTHPITVDHLTAIPRWMLGANNRYGTCGPTSVANFLVMAYKILTGEDITVTDTDVFDLYRRSGNPNFDPNTGADDNGVDMTVLLDAFLKGGMWITRATGARELVKPLCYARVAVDEETQHAVTSFAGGVLWGATMQTAQQSQTVWDYRNGSAVWGGHAIMGGRYTSNVNPGQIDESIASWAQIFGTTAAWVSHQLDESFIVVLPIMWEHPDFQAGVDRAELVKRFEMITGRTFPIPLDPPPPPPNGGWGTISGRVTDARGIPVVHALVDVVSTMGGGTGIADGAGYYAITGLAEETYDLVAVASKYTTMRIPGVHVVRGGNTTIDVVLEATGGGCGLTVVLLWVMGGALAAYLSATAG